jgi:hypothetical protein
MTGTAGKQKRPQWNYRPEVPIRVSPLFRTPFDPIAIAKWIVAGWFPVTERLIILFLALLSWFFFHPELIRCQVFQFDAFVSLRLQKTGRRTSLRRQAIG